MNGSTPLWFSPPGDVDSEFVPELPRKTSSASRWRMLAYVLVGLIAGGILLETGTGNATTVPTPDPAPVEPPAPVDVANPEETSGNEASRQSEVEPRIAPSEPRLKGRFLAPKIRVVDVTTSLLHRGFSALERNHFRAARKLFRRAAAKAPHSPDAHFGLALSAYELRRPKEAAREIQKGLLADPTHSLSNLFAGFLAQELHQPSSARAHYERYLKAEPNGRWAKEVVVVLESLP